MRQKPTLRNFVDYVFGNPPKREAASSQVIVQPKTYAPKTAMPTSGGRKSIPDPGNNGLLAQIGNDYRLVNHPFLVEVIPIIRHLVYQNEDLSQALHNIVSLGNTGHKVFFDRNVPSEQVDAMRNHLTNVKKTWAAGSTAGADGLVNRLFAQGMISGAISAEWIPRMDLKGINSCALVNPEQVYFVLGKDGVTYEPYQKPTNGYWQDKKLSSLVKLNPATYKYSALNGDTDIPYGIPPYMPALKRVKSQEKMLANIDFVIDEISLIGFLEVLVTKPDVIDGIEDNDARFESKLQGLLAKAKSQVSQSLRDGVVVGFKDDHEFKFNTLGKDLTQALELFKNNEYLLASGIKQDLSLMGRDGQSSETQITVVFMKMLSELKNLQNLVAEQMAFGYALELRLAGFQFDSLSVKFNRSTIQDDLKYQQAEEIKIRNVKDKLVLGIIDLDTAADELGYENPAESEPRVDWEIIAGGSAPAPADAAKETKNKSAKKTRDTNKPIAKNK